jgi:hypothetical protein
MLAGEAAVEGVVIPGQVVAREGAEDRGDLCQRRAIEEDRDEPGIVAAGVVDHLCGEQTLERGPVAVVVAITGRGAVLEAGAVGVRADAEDKVRPLELADHPPRPALRRRWHIAVDRGVDALAAQPIGEREHARAVLLAVMAVGDEDARGRVHWGAR